MNLTARVLGLLMTATVLHGCAISPTPASALDSASPVAPLSAATSRPTVLSVPAGTPASSSVRTAEVQVTAGGSAQSPDSAASTPIRSAGRNLLDELQRAMAWALAERQPKAEPPPSPEPLPSEAPAPGIHLHQTDGSATFKFKSLINARFVPAPGRRLNMATLQVVVDGKDQTAAVRLVARVTPAGIYELPLTAAVGLDAGKHRLRIHVADMQGQSLALDTQLLVHA